MNIQPHQKRVIDERLDLSSRLERLSDFIGTETFLFLDAKEQERMELQLDLMRKLRNVLDERIAAF